MKGFIQIRANREVYSPISGGRASSRLPSTPRISRESQDPISGGIMDKRFSFSPRERRQGNWEILGFKRRIRFLLVVAHTG